MLLLLLLPLPYTHAVVCMQQRGRCCCCCCQTGLVEEAGAVSEHTVARLERAHRDALREHMLSEQRLREELLRWRHHHPEVQKNVMHGGRGRPRSKKKLGPCRANASIVGSDASASTHAVDGHKGAHGKRAVNGQIEGRLSYTDRI